MSPALTISGDEISTRTNRITSNVLMTRGTQALFTDMESLSLLSDEVSLRKNLEIEQSLAAFQDSLRGGHTPSYNSR